MLKQSFLLQWQPDDPPLKQTLHFLTLTTENLLKQHLNHSVLLLNVTVSLSADSHRDVSVSRDPFLYLLSQPSKKGVVNDFQTFLLNSAGSCTSSRTSAETANQNLTLSAFFSVSFSSLSSSHPFFFFYVCWLKLTFFPITLSCPVLTALPPHPLFFEWLKQISRHFLMCNFNPFF